MTARCPALLQRRGPDSGARGAVSPPHPCASWGIRPGGLPWHPGCKGRVAPAPTWNCIPLHTCHSLWEGCVVGLRDTCVHVCIRTWPTHAHIWAGPEGHACTCSHARPDATSGRRERGTQAHAHGVSRPHFPDLPPDLPNMAAGGVGGWKWTDPPRDALPGGRGARARGVVGSRGEAGAAAAAAGWGTATRSGPTRRSSCRVGAARGAKGAAQGRAGQGRGGTGRRWGSCRAPPARGQARGGGVGAGGSGPAPAWRRARTAGAERVPWAVSEVLAPGRLCAAQTPSGCSLAAGRGRPPARSGKQLWAPRTGRVRPAPAGDAACALRVSEEAGALVLCRGRAGSELSPGRSLSLETALALCSSGPSVGVPRGDALFAGTACCHASLR